MHPESPIDYRCMLLQCMGYRTYEYYYVMASRPMKIPSTGRVSLLAEEEYRKQLRVYRIRLLHAVYITPSWGGFLSSIARQPRGCQCRPTHLRKALGKAFPSRRPLRHRHYSSCGDIDHGKIGSEGCDTDRRMR